MVAENTKKVFTVVRTSTRGTAVATLAPAHGLRLTAYGSRLPFPKRSYPALPWYLAL